MVFVTNNAAKVQLLFELLSHHPVLPRQTRRQVLPSCQRAAGGGEAHPRRRLRSPTLPAATSPCAPAGRGGEAPIIPLLITPMRPPFRSRR